MPNLALGRLFDLIMGVAPLDLQTARTGDYISLKNCEGVGVLIIKGAGTDGDDQTFTLQQASAVAGTGAKDAAIITEYWEKEEAAANLQATGAWTRVTQTAAATIAPGDPSAQSSAMYYFEVHADQLDVDNGFDCIRVDNDGAGSNAQLGTILYIPFGLRYQATPANLPNMIAD